MFQLRWAHICHCRAFPKRLCLFRAWAYFLSACLQMTCYWSGTLDGCSTQNYIKNDSSPADNFKIKHRFNKKCLLTNKCAETPPLSVDLPQLERIRHIETWPGQYRAFMCSMLCIFVHYLYTKIVNQNNQMHWSGFSRVKLIAIPHE